MELNFFYAKKGQYGKITLNAEELDLTINYSQLNRYRPTAADPSSFGWLPIQNGGLRQTVPRFYGTVNHRATYNSLPSSLVSEIRKFDGNNTYALDRSANFSDKDQLGHYVGIELYVQGDEGKKKVCNFMWAVIEEDDPQHPGQKILNSYYGGLYSFLCPNEGELPENSAVGTLSNTQGVTRYSPDLKIALWIITVHDDISGSPTYGQDFKVLVEAFSQPTGFPTTGVIMADMRCLTGVENASNVINGSDPKKNSTPTGWGGARNTASSADTPGVAPTALKYSVNWGAGGGHGIFLYRISTDNLVHFAQALWSDNFVKKFLNSKFSPASCVLAVMKLPYIAEIDTLAGGAGGREVSVICGGESMKDISTSYSIAAAGQPHVVTNVKAVDVLARYALGGQEQQSNEVSIEPFFNSFLDFEPYTQIHIRIPFVGMVQIPTSAVMGGKLKLNWIFDNRNGNFVCQILATSMRNLEYSDADGWFIIAQYTGCCSMPMALCANDGGGMAQMAAITGFASSAVQLGIGIGTGNVGMGVSGGAGMLQSAIDFISAPHQTQLVGTVHAEASIMEDLTVRVLITRPVDVTPGIYRDEEGKRVFDATSLLQQKGLAACSGSKVNQYEGMTVGYILGNIEGATAEEMTAIRNAFLGGVIV